MGGTCLNWGCIPTKALWSSAKLIDDLNHKTTDFGIILNGGFNIDFAKAVERKNTVVQELTDGISGLCKTKKVAVFHGFGSLTGGNIINNFTIHIEGDESCDIKTKRVILASGSKPANIPNFNVDYVKILDSNDILHPDFKNLPQALLIIGGGVIGCEFATIFAEFGVKVTIVEFLDTILANEEKLVVNTLKKKFKDLGIEVFEGVNVLKVEVTDTGILATTVPTSVPKDQIDDAEKVLYESDMCLVSIGRQKFTEGLNLPDFNIELERGSIKINHITMETSCLGVYAIGRWTGI